MQFSIIISSSAISFTPSHHHTSSSSTATQPPPSHPTTHHHQLQQHHHNPIPTNTHHHHQSSTSPSDIIIINRHVVASCLQNITLTNIHRKVYDFPPVSLHRALPYHRYLQCPMSTTRLVKAWREKLWYWEQNALCRGFRIACLHQRLSVRHIHLQHSIHTTNATHHSPVLCAGFKRCYPLGYGYCGGSGTRRQVDARGQHLWNSLIGCPTPTHTCLQYWCFDWMSGPRPVHSPFPCVRHCLGCNPQSHASIWHILCCNIVNTMVTHLLIVIL